MSNFKIPLNCVCKNPDEKLKFKRKWNTVMLENLVQFLQFIAVFQTCLGA